MFTREELKKIDIDLTSDLASLSASAGLEIDNEKAKIIADILKEYPVRSLTLLYTQLGNKEITIIVEAVKMNSTIININLTGSKLGSQGAIALAEALKENKTITDLNLTLSKITPKEAEAIAEALKGNYTLTNPNLSENKIGAQGGIAIAEALKGNYTLTNLNLSENKIGAQGGIAIAEALKRNYTLTNLDLRWNQIELKGAIAIAEALKGNYTLTNLDLRWNQISDEKLKKENLKNIEMILTRNCQFIKKLADFLVEKFIIKKEDVASEKTASYTSMFKHYQVGDKALLEKYIMESVSNINFQSGKVMSFPCLCKTVDSFINKHYLSLIVVCKTHENKEDFISFSSEDIREHVISFMGAHNLWTVEEGNDLQKIDQGERDYL